MIEMGLIPPVVKTGNLQSMRTWADVCDARLLAAGNTVCKKDARFAGLLA